MNTSASYVTPGGRILLAEAVERQMNCCTPYSVRLYEAAAVSFLPSITNTRAEHRQTRRLSIDACLKFPFEDVEDSPA